MRLSKLVTLALCLTLTPVAKAQEVFNQVVSNAKNQLDDPHADPFMLSIAQFKFAAMQYLCNTAIRKNGGQVTGDFLDEQAYGMNHFITAYFSSLAKLQTRSADIQKKMMEKFWQASAENPLFHDTDEETIHAFLNDPDCITPFSLDTDWVKADSIISQ